MGAFMIFDVSFKTYGDRKKFEKKYNVNRSNVLVDENIKCSIFAWMTVRDAKLDPIYFMGDMGYGEPEMILRECLKEGIKIKFMSWLPVNDKNSVWKKIRGRW